MKKSGKNIVKQCLLALLIVSSSPLFGGIQTIKVGAGYKSFQSKAHNNIIHSGKNISLGYGYTYGKKMLNHFQFQVSNSSREVQYDLPFVSANSNLDISQEFNFPIIIKSKFKSHSGFYIANSFSLNFFPRINRDDFIWENQIISGLSSRNSYQINSKSSINLNIQLPIYSLFIAHQLDRLTGDLPPTNQSIWEAADKQSGSVNKLFMPNVEMGFQYKVLQSLKAGFFYQANLNHYERRNGYRVSSNSHLISLRITY